MPFISDSQLNTLQRYVASTQTKMASAKVKAEEKAGEIKDICEAVGAAGVLGFIRGKLESKGKTFTIPSTQIDGELVLGAGLLTASLLDGFGKYDSDVQMAGIGIMAHYMGQIGRNWGKTGSFAAIAGVNAQNLLGVGAQAPNYDPLAAALANIV